MLLRKRGGAPRAAVRELFLEIRPFDRRPKVGEGYGGRGTDSDRLMYVATTADRGLCAPRIVYVHVPKAGGVSAFATFSRAQVPTCNIGTTGPREREILRGLSQPPCMCFGEGGACLEKSRVVVAEMHVHNLRRLPERSPEWRRSLDCTAFVASVREPSAWFYSAVSQYCSGAGARSAGCSPTATVSTLLRAGWFRQLHHSFDKAATTPVTYYFSEPSRQRRMIHGITEASRHWAVCTLDSHDRLLRAIGPMLNRTELEPLRAGDARYGWDRLEEFKRSVPWASVRRFFRVDEQLYEAVAGGPGGCRAAGRMAAILRGAADGASSSAASRDLADAAAAAALTSIGCDARDRKAPPVLSACGRRISLGWKMPSETAARLRGFFG